MNGDQPVVGTLTLTPVQSKKLLAEAIAVHPAVIHALQHHTIYIGVGTTNAEVASRLTGNDYDPLKYCAGITRNGELEVIPKEDRLPPVILRKGEIISDEPDKVFADFTRDDVMIKGANAVDLDGNAGVLLGSEEGGTVGRYLGIVFARGVNLIMPVGLEKLIPSVPVAVETMGMEIIHAATGMKVGMMPVVGAEVITEIDALHLLTGVESVLVASGGWGESQGSVTFAVNGSIDQVEGAIEWAHLVKGNRTDRPL
jgi:hypothetical protein